VKAGLSQANVLKNINDVLVPMLKTPILEHLKFKQQVLLQECSNKNPDIFVE